MGQADKKYTWSLIAKKLTGEATPEELRELEALLRYNPELHYPMQTVTDLWNPSNAHDQHAAELAFKRHLDRMKDLNVEFQNELYPEHLEMTAEMMADVSAAGNSGVLTNDAQYLRSKGKGRFFSFLRLRSRGTRVAAAVCVATLIAGAIWIGSRDSRKQSMASTADSRGFGQATLNAPHASTVEDGNNQEVFTAAGLRTNLTLPDGTKVWMNAGSRLIYAKNFGQEGRELSLIGEAYFDVAPNANKPFLIHTSKLTIRVLGTSFNVKSYPADKTTEATLVRGSIEVSILNRPSDKIVLKPNEKLVVNNEDGIPSQALGASPDNMAGESLVTISKPTYEHQSGQMIETSWVDNKLVFQDQNFGELARMMERWYGVTIRFANPALMEIRFTGSFEKETLEQALSALKISTPFAYTIDDNQITIHD